MDLSEIVPDSALICLDELHSMYENLADKSWASSSLIFSRELCIELESVSDEFYKHGAFEPAGIGNSRYRNLNPTIRGDSTLWIDSKNMSFSLQKLNSFLNTLLIQLNREFYLGFKRFEVHFAIYPIGSVYQKHTDNFEGLGARKITFILYLNQNWCSGDGGELSLYEPNNNKLILTQIEPRMGTFVMFKSDVFLHQVEKNFRIRKSLTGWFRNDDASLLPNST